MYRTKKHLLLVPYFWDRTLYHRLQSESIKTQAFYLSQHLEMPQYSIVTGFIGYPQLLTLLGSIEGIKAKEIYFVGTAGAVNEKIGAPISLNITEVFSSSIYRLFSRQHSFSLKTMPRGNFKTAKSVCVDLPDRETRSWLKQQREYNIDAVEMELFPLRIFLKKEFTALLVITDIVKGDGKINLMDRKRIKTEFSRTLQQVITILNQF